MDKTILNKEVCLTFLSMAGILAAALFGMAGFSFAVDTPSPLPMPVPEGVFRVVDPGGSGGTLEFAMHPVSGTLLASSDMGRSLLRSRDGGRTYEAIAPDGQPTISMLVPHPTRAGVWFTGFSNPSGQGLFKSQDDGEHWALIHESRDFARDSIAGLAIEEGQKTTLIWMIEKKGLVISRDEGKTFEDFNQGLPSNILLGGAKNLSARNLLLAASGQNDPILFLGTRSGLFQRPLNAPGWEKPPGSPDGGISTLAFDPGRNRLWVGMAPNQIHILDLKTGAWQTVSPPADEVTLLKTHPARPGQVWCFAHGRAGLFTSKDAGKTWEWLTRRDLTRNKTYQGNVPRDFRHRYKFQRDYFFILPKDPDHLLLGDMYQSRDGGATWQFSATAFDPGTGGWQGRGLTLLTSYKAFWDTINPNRVYLGFSDTGLMVSPDRGKSVVSIWSSQYPDLSGLAYWSRQMIDSSGSCMAFATDPDDPATQFYGMSGKGGKDGVCGLLFKTGTDGRHWAPVLPGSESLPSGIITDLEILPGTGFGNRELFVALNTLEHGKFPQAAIYVSEDSGEHFRLLADSVHQTLSFPLMNLSICRDTPDVIYAAASSEGGKRPAKQLKKVAGSRMDRGGVFKSVDHGKTWSRAGGMELDGTVQVEVHPHNPDIAFAAVAPGESAGKAEAFFRQGGIYRTTDGGMSWNLVLGQEQIFPGQEHPPRIDPASVAINPALPDIVYAAVERDGVYRSLDGGKTWEPVAWEHLKRFQGNYHTLTVNPHDPSEFYLALFGNAFLAYKDPVAVRAMKATSFPLVQNSGFELGIVAGHPVHWQWQNMGYPGPQDPDILSIQKAPGREGQALKINLHGGKFSHPELTGPQSGPITFMGQRLSPWAMAAIRGKTVQLQMDILVHKIKSQDTPLLTVSWSGDRPALPVAELTIPRDQSKTWKTVTTEFSVPPEARSLVLTLLATEKDAPAELFVDNIQLNPKGEAHGD